jgi:hypothetical protein
MQHKESRKQDNETKVKSNATLRTKLAEPKKQIKTDELIRLALKFSMVSCSFLPKLKGRFFFAFYSSFVVEVAPFQQSENLVLKCCKILQSRKPNL